MSDLTPARNPGPEMSVQATPSTPRTTTFNLLFLCTGNTCRSPLAEAIARDAVAARGWRHVRVQSAGVSAAPGCAASPEGVAVAARAGIDLSGHRSQPLTPGLAQWADLILAMSPSHLAVVDRVGAGEKEYLECQYLKHSQSVEENRNKQTKLTFISMKIFHKRFVSR